MKMPLAGIKVVDLTRILSGPFCTMMLGDMGADVIKIEGSRDGDPIRKIGVIVNDLSWYFASFNRNKRSVALDLRSDEGKQTLARPATTIRSTRPMACSAPATVRSPLRRVPKPSSIDS